MVINKYINIQINCNISYKCEMFIIFTSRKFQWREKHRKRGKERERERERERKREKYSISELGTHYKFFRADVSCEYYVLHKMSYVMYAQIIHYVIY